MNSDVKIKPVILCGGAGTRLWPLSTTCHPKQFLKLTGDKTMLEEALTRVSDPDFFDRPSVIANVQHKHFIADLDIQTDAIFEPMGRNSAPAVAISAVLADPEDILLIMPADHHIENGAAFRRAIETGLKAVVDGRMVTFGVVPEYPATGYGYIKAAENNSDRILDVQEFVEKPDFDTAKTFLSAGTYFWNAGIFLFRAKDMVDALSAFAPDILEGVRAVIAVTPISEGDDAIDLDQASFQNLRSESIDYAVMEHCTTLAVIPVEMGWADIGDFSALSDFVGGTYVKGPVSVAESNNVYARSEGPSVIVRGVENLIVVATGDKVLVAAKSDVAQIKDQVSLVMRRGQAQGLNKALEKQVSSWLFQDCLPHWMSEAWDEENGGFVEALSMDGRAITDHDRRGRVAPRQVFSFSRALRLARLIGAAIDEDRLIALISNGLDFLNTTARTPVGTWAHALSPQGQVCDDRRSVYDHAFVALAGAEAYTVTGAKLAQDLAREAFNIVDTQFLDQVHGGYVEVDLDPTAKKSNPHMHLLEASLAWYRASNDPSALARAKRVVRLFETKMFDYENGVILENFKENWEADKQADQFWYEPGHCFEWAVLLAEYSALSGNCTRSWQHRLIASGEKSAVKTWSDIVPDRIYLNKPDVTDDRTFRLWPQLERLRASLLCCSGQKLQDSNKVLSTINGVYLDQGTGHGWIDCYADNGDQLSEVIPASVLYHNLTALGALLVKLT